MNMGPTSASEQAGDKGNGQMAEVGPDGRHFGMKLTLCLFTND